MQCRYIYIRNYRRKNSKKKTEGYDRDESESFKEAGKVNLTCGYNIRHDCSVSLIQPVSV